MKTVRPILVPLLCLAAACACGGPVHVGEQLDRIVNGTIETGHPTVGELLTEIPGSSLLTTCTANLVGPGWVLTAAHCVTSSGASTFQLASGTYKVSDRIINENWDRTTTDPQCDDIAILKLDASTGMPPEAPASVSAQAPDVLAQVLLVGFGLSNASDPNSHGTKRSIKKVVASTDSNRLGFLEDAAGGVFCLGDSGGPTFAVIGGHEVQVGVHSAVVNDSCTQAAYDCRIDSYISWLRQKSAGGVVAADTSAPAAIPRITILSPSTDAPWRGTGQMTFRVDGPNPLNLVEAEVDGVLVAKHASAGAPSPSGSRFSVALTLTPGPRQITLRARDNVTGLIGEQNWRVVAEDAIPDSIPPTLTIVSPADMSTVAGDLSVVTTASDNVKVATVEMQVDGHVLASRSAPPYTFQLSPPPARYTLTFVAYDTAGNTTKKDLRVEISAGAPAAQETQNSQQASSAPRGCSVRSRNQSAPPLDTCFGIAAGLLIALNRLAKRRARLRHSAA